MAPSITSRALRTDDDWWRIRDFVSSAYPITPTGFVWDIRRWDGWRFHRERPVPVRRLREVIRIWESSGRIVTVRKPSLPDAEQARVYKILGIDWKRACPAVKSELKATATL